ncbi:hypothetical protein D3C81_1773290 [compost metagenome]
MRQHIEPLQQFDGAGAVGVIKQFEEGFQGRSVAQTTQQHVGYHVQPWYQAEVLEDHAATGTPLAHLAGAQLCDVLCHTVIFKVQHLAAARRNGAVQGVQQSRFTGAGTADHRHEFANVQVEIDIVQHPLL